jgi:hypothetical protein
MRAGAQAGLDTPVDSGNIGMDFPVANPLTGMHPARTNDKHIGPLAQSVEQLTLKREDHFLSQ